MTAKISAAVSRRWRVIDIVVASVMGVASGVVFLAWNAASIAPSELVASALPGLQGLLDGPWLFAGVLGGLVIRKPGAALYTELVAAAVSAVTQFANTWGPALTLESGLVQGLGAELVFLVCGYRLWRLPVAVLAGVGAAVFGGVNNMLIYYSQTTSVFLVVYLVCTVISGAVIDGFLSWLAARGLASTGALDRFAAGRAVRQRV